jgi:hypothetical protein
LKKGDAVFALQKPSLPATVNAQDSLVFQICYTSQDLKRHQDTVIISNGCFDIPITLDAHSATGLITADDINFGNVDTGKEVNKTLTVQNIGSAPFILMKSPKLSDDVNFAIDPNFLSTLPVNMPVGGKVTVKVFFHPKQPVIDSAGIVWTTDIDPAFLTTGKNYSILMGTGLEVITKSVRGNAGMGNSLSVRPNPAIGNSAIVSFALPDKDKASLMIYDLLGREVFKMNLKQGTGELEIPIGVLPRGVYQVRITSDDIVLTQKLEVIR